MGKVISLLASSSKAKLEGTTFVMISVVQPRAVGREAVTYFVVFDECKNGFMVGVDFKKLPFLIPDVQVVGDSVGQDDICMPHAH